MQKGLLGILIGLTFAGAASADEWIVEAHFADQAALQRAARHFEHVIVDGKRNTLRVETTEKGIRALEAEGLAVSIDTAATARLQAANARVAAAIGNDTKGNVSLVLYVLGISLAFVHPRFADAFYVIVALIWLVPDRRIEPRLVEDRDDE